MLAAAGLVAALVLAGCSNAADTSMDEVPTPTAVGAAPAVETPSPAAVVTAPDVCSAETLRAIAAAAGVADFGTPTPVADDTFRSGHNAFGDFRNVSYCTLVLADGARKALKMDPAGSSLDILVGVSAYGGQRFSSGGNGWTDSSPSTLLSTYLAANSEQIGTNSVATMVDATTIQDGSTVIATINDRYWLEVTMYRCKSKDCGPAALAVAQALVPTLASAR